VHKTKRESTSSPDIAVKKLPFWGSFLEGAWGNLFLEKGSPTKNSSTKKRLTCPRDAWWESRKISAKKKGVDKRGGGVVK